MTAAAPGTLPAAAATTADRTAAAALDRIAAARAALHASRHHAARAEDDYRAAIRAALADDIPAIAIAKAGGITRRRVYQIRDHRR
jgi:hypothetical protein